ncbi:hypothetical protein PAXRUDRAFT_26940 [Paxillus rubicundulus Ve08.2h10]|uniref:Uncharacterized protein n=1 Tax=Paxillus rubicundulus Ve08.2h10 TaxID=930991 RepID=A0A0D0DYJ8_9AGAM|nr:hypothetical protein PAXRUDRAFT_26940 [Paxillus rubicundulus Ve08.2h10]
MPHVQYAYCSCKSYGCANNTNGSSQKLQVSQTAAQHQRVDKILIAACLKAAGQQDADEQGENPSQAGGSNLPHDSRMTASEKEGSPAISIEESDHQGMPAWDDHYHEPPYYPELAELFEDHHEQPPPDFKGDPGAFSSDPDEEIFECLGWVHIEEVLDEDEPDGPIECANVEYENGEHAVGDDNELNTIPFVSQGTDFDFSDAHETADIHVA